MLIKLRGINSNTNYIVTEVDKNNFKLSSVGVGTTSKFLYYETEQYIDLSIAGLGTGTHTFNYEPITVSLTGDIGVATLLVKILEQNFNLYLKDLLSPFK